MLGELAASDSQCRISCLQYFNSEEAHLSGELGEDSTGSPTNLVPYINQVAIGQRHILKVFGDDYPTSDNTGIRDYIYVCDLVKGHLKAMEFLSKNSGVRVHNMATGRGHSVSEMSEAFREISNQEISLMANDHLIEHD